ncbi:PREDICTED: cyclin-dependent kinase inhibitor 1C-like [Ceratosolen solmsi marchali]|uniref:Cyclin-dependent kinase inhibitor 1C-like n=1 Tax=Ceratosolen solmsi marchali TaxID=326594 RepID=A0AAJ6VLY2_9HYME|nr:PREDICTED: cyclin-dependent kinase inhibitor 1C-like [Ceratosolen solmsi marchali]
MQPQIFILLAMVAVALAASESRLYAAENTKDIPLTNKKIDDTKKNKRGLFDLGYGYASPYAYSAYSAPSLYTAGVHTNTVITKEVPYPVPHPVAVPVEKHVPYPVIQKVAVPVDRPVAVPVPKPYAVEVAKPVPVPVDRPVPYPVHVPLVKHVGTPYAVEVPQPYSVPIVKQVAGLPYSQPLVLDKYPGLATYTSW